MEKINNYADLEYELSDCITSFIEDEMDVDYYWFEFTDFMRSISHEVIPITRQLINQIAEEPDSIRTNENLIYFNQAELMRCVKENKPVPSYVKKVALVLHLKNPRLP